MTQEIGTRPTVAICGLISLLAAIATFVKYKDRGQEPDSFAIADVLEPTYENKKD
jgi:hypothetical protein